MSAREKFNALVKQGQEATEAAEKAEEKVGIVDFVEEERISRQRYELYKQTLPSAER